VTRNELGPLTGLLIMIFHVWDEPCSEEASISVGSKAHQLFEGALKKSGHEYFGGSHNLTHLEIGCAFRSQISI